jgi:hypothetical protein
MLDACRRTHKQGLLSSIMSFSFRQRSLGEVGEVGIVTFLIVEEVVIPN